MVDTESIEDVERERERFREDTMPSSLSLSDARLEPRSVSFAVRTSSAMPFLIKIVSEIGNVRLGLGRVYTCSGAH